MVTKATFVGAGFTRKPPKYERFIRPTGLRFTKAHVTHPELKCTFNLDIISVKKNPNGPMYTSLGVMTRGTIIEVCQAFLPVVLNSPCSWLVSDYIKCSSWFIEIISLYPPSQKLLLTMVLFQVNVSELGLVTPAGKVVWGEKSANFALLLPNLPWIIVNKPNFLCCREICSSYKQPGEWWLYQCCFASVEP